MAAVSPSNITDDELVESVVETTPCNVISSIDVGTLLSLKAPQYIDPGPLSVASIFMDDRVLAAACISTIVGAGWRGTKAMESTFMDTGANSGVPAEHTAGLQGETDNDGDIAPTEQRVFSEQGLMQFTQSEGRPSAAEGHLFTTHSEPEQFFLNSPL